MRLLQSTYSAPSLGASRPPVKDEPASQRGCRGSAAAGPLSHRRWMAAWPPADSPETWPVPVSCRGWLVVSGCSGTCRGVRAPPRLSRRTGPGGPAAAGLAAPACTTLAVSETSKM